MGWGARIAHAVDCYHQWILTEAEKRVRGMMKPDEGAFTLQYTYVLTRGNEWTPVGVIALLIVTGPARPPL